VTRHSRGFRHIISPMLGWARAPGAEHTAAKRFGSPDTWRWRHGSRPPHTRNKCYFPNGTRGMVSQLEQRPPAMVWCRRKSRFFCGTRRKRPVWNDVLLKKPKEGEHGHDWNERRRTEFRRDGWSLCARHQVRPPLACQRQGADAYRRPHAGARNRSQCRDLHVGPRGSAAAAGESGRARRVWEWRMRCSPCRRCRTSGSG